MTHRDPNAPKRPEPRYQSITLKWEKYSDISIEAARLGVTRAKVIELMWNAYMATQQPATRPTLEVR